MRRSFNDLFPRLGRIVIEGDFDLHTRAASKYDDRRVIHLPAFKIWWVQGRVFKRIYQSQYRRPVSSVGRAPVFWAGDREFKPRPDQHSMSLKKTWWDHATTSCKNTWDTWPYFVLIACPWSCACDPRPLLPLSKLPAIQDHAQTLVEWRGEGRLLLYLTDGWLAAIWRKKGRFLVGVSRHFCNCMVVVVTKGDVTRDDS